MAERINIQLILIVTAISLTYASLFLRRSYHKPWDYHDHMSYTEKLKLINITMELMADANLKIRQTLEIRDKYSKSTAFEVGTIIGKIREKYRQMMETYRQMRDKVSGRSENLPPTMRNLRPIHFIVSMEVVWLMQRQVDKMVDILEVTVDTNMEFKKNKPKKVENTTEIDTTESTTESEKSLRALYKEELLKRRYREQYLMRRLGMPKNTTTTKKRFIHQWPVEDTWSLGVYDDMGNK